MNCFLRPWHAIIVLSQNIPFLPCYEYLSFYYCRFLGSVLVFASLFFAYQILLFCRLVRKNAWCTRDSWCVQPFISRQICHVDTDSWITFLNFYRHFNLLNSGFRRDLIKYRLCLDWKFQLKLNMVISSRLISCWNLNYLKMMHSELENLVFQI